MLATIKYLSAKDYQSDQSKHLSAVFFMDASLSWGREWGLFFYT